MSDRDEQGDMEALDEFRRMLDAANRVVVFTGAGISTESGIPDFRSPGTGLWNKMKPTQFSDFVASDEVRQESWARRFGAEHSSWADAKPNKGHEGVAKLVAEGKCTAVITQNIDNLHQDSGIPDAQVIELHGNNSYAKCLSCETRYEMADLERQFKDLGRVEPCSGCGGIIKSATISFGQSMPEDAMMRSQTHTDQCDLFIVIGSSLVVYPAAGFPEHAKRLGAKLVILNREETGLDPIADLVLHQEIGPTMSYVVGIN
ncbi:MAG: Sir2 family NAD-dependent protein deacetylase [Gammaproteobacteria bacterium]|nr:Sir2 family NAD-dependent protein deacetylase [Gammaproteobacteria bacterium]